MKSHEDGTRATIKLMFRLLPVQILVAAVGTVNNLISSFFASNYVTDGTGGIYAMSAVGLYGPISTLYAAITALLSGGAAILCGKFMGRNDREGVRKVFSSDLLLSLAVAIPLAAVCLLLGVFNLTGFLTSDDAVCPFFNRYLIGQAAGDIPYVLGGQLAVFLALENRQNRTLAASLVYIAVNLAAKWLFVIQWQMGTLGLGLSASVGQWVFLGIQASYFMSRKAKIRPQPGDFSWKTARELVQTGLPGAASNGYQTIRGIIVNGLLGTVGISAFAAANNFLGIFWSVPTGMLAVSRMMISISVGEEDRQTLADVMKNMFVRFVPIMCGISAVVILCAEPIARLFFQDPNEPVYMMTVWGFRLLPVCMPLSIICMHYMCYGQTMGQKAYVHTLAVLDGVMFVAGFSALLVGRMGINGVYLANILNGVGCVAVIFAWAWVLNHRFPRRAGDLMVFPEGFGADADERIDISVRTLDEVLTVSKQVGEFCRQRRIDGRRAYMASLCLEEMVANIVTHGFEKDRKQHSVDIRVVHKDEDLILRIRDDCIPFDPEERNRLTDSGDRFGNMGIRMAYKAARNVEYQSILGLNVLTMRV